MTSDAIVSETIIDSLGNYSFDISFLPEDDNLFRLHIVKKGESANTLIIGGRDENHLFILANCHSYIEINNSSIKAPFKGVRINNSPINIAFRQIKNLVDLTDSIVRESSSIKETFIENQLNTQLMDIADTSSNALVSLYAIYNTDFENTYMSNLNFFNSYLKKWTRQKNTYFDVFRKTMNFPQKNPNIWLIILLVITMSSASYYIGHWTKKNNARMKMLSVQERKVLELLKKGATNQDISEELNIGISTVKSHVSSIFVKLNIKSRKEAMNLK